MCTKVMIAFHGMFPRADLPLLGNVLRAKGLAQGLEQAGFEVHLAVRPIVAKREFEKTRENTSDNYHVYNSPRDLQQLIDRVEPAVLVHLQPEELPDLPDLGVFTIADLFAPREMESRFQSNLASRVPAQRIAAISRADAFLCTNSRQRYYYMGWLLMAGVDISMRPLLTVPLCIDESIKPRLEPPAEPIMVAGGVSWPWIDLEPAVRAIVNVFEQRQQGKLIFFQGDYPVKEALMDQPGHLEISSSRLELSGLLPYGSMIDTYCRASAALDAALLNEERELAMSFRTMDYMACGIPLIVSKGSLLAHVVENREAGWTVDPNDPKDITAVVATILDDIKEVNRRGRNARKMGEERFTPQKAVAQLAALIKGSPNSLKKNPDIFATLARAAEQGFKEREAHKYTLSELEKLSGKLKSSQMAHERSMEELAHTRQELGRNQDLLAEARREKEAEKMKTARLAQEIDQLKNEILRLKSRIAEIEPRAAEFEKLSNRARELEQLEQEQQRAKDRLKEDLRSLSIKLEQAHLEIERQQAARQAETTRADRNDMRANKLNERIEEIKKLYAQDEENIAVLIREKARIEQELKLLMIESSKLRNKAQNQERLRQEEINLRDAEINRLHSETDKISKERDRTMARLAEVESLLDAERRRLDSARHQMSSLERELNSLKQDPLYRLYAALKQGLSRK
ncbi:MAG: glycosyltransferase [Deltaproteobacteria bacterium]|nr:glycosyltransferase [Deltaproteobacteria bacterium]